MERAKPCLPGVSVDLGPNWRYQTESEREAMLRNPLFKRLREVQVWDEQHQKKYRDTAYLSLPVDAITKQGITHREQDLITRFGKELATFYLDFVQSKSSPEFSKAMTTWIGNQTGAKPVSFDYPHLVRITHNAYSDDPFYEPPAVPVSPLTDVDKRFNSLLMEYGFRPRYLEHSWNEIDPKERAAFERWFPTWTRKGVIVSGSVGVGKSTAISLAYREVLEKYTEPGIPPVISFVDCGSIVTALVAKEYDDRKVAIDAKTAPILILDDLGASGVLPDWKQDKFREFIDYRWSNKLPTTVTTNLMCEEDVAMCYGKPVADRIFDPSIAIVLAWKSKESRRTGHNWDNEDE